MPPFTSTSSHQLCRFATPGKFDQRAHLRLGVAGAHARGRWSRPTMREAVAQQGVAHAARALLGLDLAAQDVEVELGDGRARRASPGPPPERIGTTSSHGHHRDAARHHQAARGRGGRCPPAPAGRSPRTRPTSRPDLLPASRMNIRATAPPAKPMRPQAHVAEDDRQHGEVGQAQAEEGGEVVLVAEQRAHADQAAAVLGARRGSVGRCRPVATSAIATRQRQGERRPPGPRAGSGPAAGRGRAGRSPIARPIIIAMKLVQRMAAARVLGPADRERRPHEPDAEDARPGAAARPAAPGGRPSAGSRPARAPAAR